VHPTAAGQRPFPFWFEKAQTLLNSPVLCGAPEEFARKPQGPVEEVKRPRARTTPPDFDLVLLVRRLVSWSRQYFPPTFLANVIEIIYFVRNFQTPTTSDLMVKKNSEGQFRGDS
jgi:hypothetical protein